MHQSLSWPRFSTEDVPPSQRFAYWKRGTLKALVALDVADVADEGLRATQTIADLGSLRAVCIESNAHVVERPQRLVARHAKDATFLCLMLEGTGFVYQGSSCVTLLPGDLVLYEPSRTYIHGFTTAVRQVTFDLPAAEFARRFGPWRERAAVRIGAGVGEGAAASERLTHHAAMLFGEDRPAACAAADRALRNLSAEAIWDSARAALAAAFPQRYPSRVERDDLARIKTFVRERLNDAELDLGRVADALAVSARLVQRRFARTGTSFSEWLRTERLERAARKLVDPAHLACSITTVSLDVGFVDSAHFSRAFRTKFGVSPSDWRRQTLGIAAH